MLTTFRILSFIEGLSLIALLFIAMPAKYGFDYDMVRIVGPAHGLLWLAFIPLLEIVSRQQGWPKSFWNYAMISSVLPFGCFFLENRLRERAINNG